MREDRRTIRYECTRQDARRLGGMRGRFITSHPGRSRAPCPTPPDEARGNSSARGSGSFRRLPPAASWHSSRRVRDPSPARRRRLRHRLPRARSLAAASGGATTPAPAAIDATPVSAPLAPAPAQPTTAAAKPDPASSPEKRARPPRQARAKSPPRAAPTSPATAAAPSASRSPADMCAGGNFIWRAICVSRQCKTPGWQAHPECVDARRIEEKRQRWTDR